jgi:hypothetical protein
MLASLGSVYASAPTNVAADNFAERLDLISQRVAARRNKGKSAGDKKRARSALVLRGYNNGMFFIIIIVRSVIQHFSYCYIITYHI